MSQVVAPRARLELKHGLMKRATVSTPLTRIHLKPSTRTMTIWSTTTPHDNMTLRQPADKQTAARAPAASSRHRLQTRQCRAQVNWSRTFSG
jgi:hypothetical protein